MEILNQRVLAKNKLAEIVETEDGTQYCCVECSERYFEKEKLEVHLLTHNKEHRFLCGICGTGLKRKEHLDRHTLGHQEVRPHVCDECGKGFKRKEHLNIHRSIHSGDKSQICPICRRSFYRKDHLQKHLQTHNRIFLEQNIYPLTEQEVIDIKREVEEVDVKEDIIEDLGCEVSMEVEENTTLAQAPLSYRSSDPERPFACSLCHKTYKRKDHLKLHQYSHMVKDKICGECGKGFHRQEQLLAHMTTSHMDPLTLHYDNCDSQPYTDNSVLDVIQDDPMDLLVERSWQGLGSMRPRRKRANKDERRHECTICGRRFKRKQHLKVHGNVHLKLQPTIWCSLCSEGFLTNTQFEKHKCTGQGNSEEQACAPDKKENDHPKQEYQQYDEINEDAIEPSCEIPQLSLEQEQALPAPARVFVCKFCGKPFKRKDHFKIHTHIHTGVKSFFCPHCGKGFYRKDHLQKHAQVHDKPTRLRPKKALPDLYPIAALPKKIQPKPEITITAPSNSKLRLPLQIKVPYQMVLSMDNGHKRSVTVNPQNGETSSL